MANSHGPDGIIWENPASAENVVGVKLKKIADFPFERDLYFSNGIVWKVQRDLYEDMEKKGCPEYLGVVPEKIMFLEDDPGKN